VAGRVRFASGRWCCTRGVITFAVGHGVSLTELVERHLRGDWGDLSAADKRENEASIRLGLRILSAYVVRGTKLYVITEADRSTTTVLLADEY